MITKTKPTPSISRSTLSLPETIRLACKVYPNQCHGAWKDSHGGRCVLASVLDYLGQDSNAWASKGQIEVCQYLQSRFPEVNYTTFDNLWRQNDYEQSSREEIADMIEQNKI